LTSSPLGIKEVCEVIILKIMKAETPNKTFGWEWSVKMWILNLGLLKSPRIAREAICGN
jgi:hypothetical protein